MFQQLTYLTFLQLLIDCILLGSAIVRCKHRLGRYTISAHAHSLQITPEIVSQA